MNGQAVSTRRLSVNAAFLKEIKDDNLQLKALIDQIAPLASHQQMATNHWRELVRLFDALRDQLAVHFALEEAYGYFDDAVGTEPQFSAMAECLRGEHSRLYESIRHLADRSEEIKSDDEDAVARILKRFAGFQRAFQKHEEAELNLILDALDDGIGVGD